MTSISDVDGQLAAMSARATSAIREGMAAAGDGAGGPGPAREVGGGSAGVGRGEGRRGLSDGVGATGDGSMLPRGAGDSLGLQQLTIHQQHQQSDHFHF